MPSNTNNRIIYYHSIGEKDLLSIKNSLFYDQMKWLKVNGFRTCFLDEFIKEPNKNNNNNKIIAITFDDGYEDNYTDAYPILREFNLKATVFVVSNFIGKVSKVKSMLYPNRRMLTEEQIIEMSNNLIEFGSHTSNHKNIGKVLRNEDVIFREEIYHSKRIIEKIINKKIYSFSYPFGQFNCFNELSKTNLIEAGYSCAVTTLPRRKLHWSKYELPRVEISVDDNIESFKNKILGKYEVLHDIRSKIYRKNWRELGYENRH